MSSAMDACCIPSIAAKGVKAAALCGSSRGVPARSHRARVPVERAGAEPVERRHEVTVQSIKEWQCYGYTKIPEGLVAGAVVTGSGPSPRLARLHPQWTASRAGHPTAQSLSAQRRYEVSQSLLLGGGMSGNFLSLVWGKTWTGFKGRLPRQLEGRIEVGTGSDARGQTRKASDVQAFPGIGGQLVSDQPGPCCLSGCA